MDALTLQRIELLHPKLRVEAKTIYTEIFAALTGKARFRADSTLRTYAEQTALYAQGRTKPGEIVTNGQAGYSWHNHGFALDFALIVDTDGNGTFETTSWNRNKDYDGDGKADWMEVVAIFKKHGWVWGGDWKSLKDYPHFEKAMGLTLTGARHLKALGKVDAHGYIIF